MVIILFVTCVTSQVLGNKEMDMLCLTMLSIAKNTQRQF
jgi:hypothetical protein